MEAIIFCGIQATGKTTFYLKNFFKTHIRISMDQLNTRNKENIFIDACLSVQQPFVIDNTNPTKEERARYIQKSKARKFKVICYYFHSQIESAILRNNGRTGSEKIPEIGIRGTFKKLELPEMNEGFDQVYMVQLIENNFLIKSLENDI